jgi:hypothetical protein
MTNPRPAQLLGGLLLCMIVALLSAELLRALAADACPAGPSCYPWGAEGPAAGAWSYDSKANYIMRGVAQLALILSAGPFLIWKAGRDSPMSTLQRVASLGALGLAALLAFV